MDYFLGIDLGTSYFKAGIFDGTGHLMGLGRRAVPKETDGTTCELPVDIFWETIGNCLSDAIQMAGIPAGCIKSISYSTQVNSFLLLDKNNDPLTPLILWPDGRAGSMEPPPPGRDSIKCTGLGIGPDAQSAVAKLHWIQKHHPDIWKQTTGIMSISDFLTFSLTGQKVCDYSTASMSGLFDVENCSWWDEALERVGISTEMLPAPGRTGTFVGPTTTNALNLAGLPAGISFCLGGLDHHMATLGSGIPSNGYISESTGTVLSCVEYTDGYTPDQNMCTAPGLSPKRFFRMMFNGNGATSLEWYRNNYAPGHTIPELLEMAGKVEPGCEGLTASPYADTFSGLSAFSHSGDIRYGHGHYVRAILESTAHSLQQMIAEMHRGRTVPAVVSTGGGSMSELWVEIKSKTVNSTFLIPECTESACMGAAMMGAMGIGAFENYEAIVDSWVRFRKTIDIPAKLVLFGAGKIGRSFIGQLFSRSGYEVVFIDKDREVVDALNRERSYKVLICDRHSETIAVDHVRGVYADDHAAVADEIASADILAISIGKVGLPHIIPVLSRGLLQREKETPGRALDIILAENMRNADVFFRESLSKALPVDYPLDKRIGLVETSIGKMVPLTAKQPGDDILSVVAEAYNTLIVDKQAFKNPIPAVAGLVAKEHMKAWVDRKLFIHNFGHAAVSYLGYLYHPEKIYLWEVLEDCSIRDMVKDAMSQSADVLRHIYPHVFTREELYEHIEDLLYRFANAGLGDAVFRVGCDLYRKLAPDDRVVTPLVTAFRNGLPYDMIAPVLAAAMHFKATGADGKMFPGDVDFHLELEKTGIESVLKNICGLTDETLILNIV